MHARIDSPDDFAATDPAEVALTRRRILQAAGLVTVGGLATAFGADRAMAATKKRKSSTATTRATTKTTATTKATSTTVGSSATCDVIPEETGGPFPGDGSNGVNILTQNGVVRSDIRSSFGSYSGKAAGVPLTLKFALRSISKGCAPLVGAAFYAWHCDKDGQYSLYSLPSANYLRGVQVSDSDGIVTFQTAFPGAYLGRWPHVHFEIFASAADATTSRNAIHTSQLALPEATCNLVYATSGYEASKQNFPQTPLSRDNVFSDGWTSQLGTVSGDITKGLTCTLPVNV